MKKFTLMKFPLIKLLLVFFCTICSLGEIQAQDADNDGILDVVDKDDDNDGIPDDIEVLGFTTVTGSSSASCVAPSLDFENNGGTDLTFNDNDSSADFSIGDTWRYDNIAPNTYAIITYQNATSGSVLLEFDDDTQGFPSAFNPRVQYNFDGGGTITTAFVELRFQFFNATTDAPVDTSFGGSSYDMDGQRGGEAGTGESQLFFGADAFILEGPEPTNIVGSIINSPIDGVDFTAGALQGAGIDTAAELRGYFLYNSTSQFTMRLQFKASDLVSGQNRQYSFAVDKCTAIAFEDPLITVINGIDSDGDGISDHLDLDSDNDGVYDLDESGSGATDADNDGIVDGPVGSNGLPDAVEISPDSDEELNYTMGNADGDLTTNGSNQYDFIDTDSDNDSCSDANEAYGGSTVDGGDGGQFGSVDPSTVDLSTGLVIESGVDYTIGTNAAMYDSGDSSACANRNPVALDDTGSTTLATSVTINVLSNDSDPDTGDSLTVTQVDGSPITDGGVPVVLSDGTSVALVGGQLQVTPPANSTNPVAFNYTIGDGNGGSATANVFITVTDPCNAGTDAPRFN